MYLPVCRIPEHRRSICRFSPLNRGKSSSPNEKLEIGRFKVSSRCGWYKCSGIDNRNFAIFWAPNGHCGGFGLYGSPVPSKICLCRGGGRRWREPAALARLVRAFRFRRTYRRFLFNLYLPYKRYRKSTSLLTSLLTSIVTSLQSFKETFKIFLKV